MKIELCAASIEAINFAKKYNFDRIELCQNLEQGGLTPSDGLIQLAIEKGLSTHVLIRVRPGGFVYSYEEVEVMLSDIKRCVQLGVDGIVIGALTVNGEIDIDVIKQMISCAKNLEVTFHRAFDVVPKPKESLVELIKMGVGRLLTSGQEEKAENGINLLIELQKLAKNKLTILPGGGINSKNCIHFKNTGFTEIHSSASKTTSRNTHSFFGNTPQTVSDTKTIKNMLDTIA